jgi:hypothetical protein
MSSSFNHLIWYSEERRHTKIKLEVFYLVNEQFLTKFKLSVNHVYKTLMDLVTNTTNDSIDHVYNFNGSGY